MIYRTSKKQQYLKLNTTELQNHLRLTDDIDYLELQQYIDAAWDYAESISGYMLTLTQISLSIDNYNGREIFLPYNNVRKIITVTDTYGTDLLYTFNGVRQSVTVLQTSEQPINIVFECGFTQLEDIPHTIIQAVYMSTASFYANRENESPLSLNTVPLNVKCLLELHTFRI